MKLKFFIITIFVFLGALFINKQVLAVDIAVDMPVANIQGDITRLTTEKNEEEFLITYSDSKNKVNFTKNITLKFQGSTSLNYAKHNFTLKIFKDDTYTEKEKIDMGHGWGENDKYCLKANVVDKTHARNIISARLDAQINEKYNLFENTPNNGQIDGFPVQIYVNGEFYGLYTWNIPKDAWTYNIDKKDINNTIVQANLCNDYTNFKKKIDTTLEESKWEIIEGKDTEENVINKLNRLIEFVSESSDEEFKQNINQYINKDAMLNYLSIVYATEAYDNMAKNLVLATYDGNLWYPILYDLDTTWGTRHRGSLGTNPGLCDDYYWVPDGESGYKSYAQDANNSVLMKKFIKCFNNELADRWFELRKNELSYDNIKNKFEEFCSKIPDSVYQADQNKWSSISAYGKWDITQIYGSETSFLETRLPYIDDLMYEKYSIQPEITINYSNTNITNQNVTATAVANRADIQFNKNENIYTFKQNGIHQFQASDYKGNIISIEANVTWIDKTGPTIDINKEYMDNRTYCLVTMVTNEPVEEIDGWTLSTDQMTLTKIYTENVTEIVTVMDLAGNKTNVPVSISNIGTTTLTIKGPYYSMIFPTNQNVTVRIVASEEVQEINGWTLADDKKTLTKTYETNVVEEITITDLEENKVNTTIIINNIDKTVPTIANLIYSSTEPTNQNVTVTVVANEELQETSGWTLADDKKSLTKEYTKNKIEEVIIKDLAGNETKTTISIDNIDKIAPSLQITRKYLNNKTSCLVTIVASEQIQEIPGWTLSTDKTTLTKTYTENTEDEIVIKDLLGNKTNTTITITEIEKLLFEIKEYTIENNTIKNIQPNVLYKDFINNIITNQNYSIEENGISLTNTDKIKTGQKLKVGQDEYTLVVKGDTNGDGNADIKDIMNINKHRLKKTELKDCYLEAGDINKDGIVDIKDIMQVNKYRLGKINEL